MSRELTAGVLSGLIDDTESSLMNAIQAVMKLLDNVRREMGTGNKLVKRTDGLIDNLRKELNDISRISDELDDLRDDFKKMDLDSREVYRIMNLASEKIATEILKAAGDITTAEELIATTNSNLKSDA